MSKLNKDTNKVLLITRNLPPLVGGMERLNWNMAKGLAEHGPVTIVGPSIAKGAAPQGVKFSGVPLKPLWLFLICAQIKAIFQTLKYRPTHVIAGSGLTAPIALIGAKLIGAKAITYTHGLDVAVTHPLYKSFWIPSLKLMDTIIANSTPTKNLLLARGVKQSRIDIIHPGVDIPEQPPTETAINNFKQQYDLQEGPILLSVGRLTTRKGLKEFVVKSLPSIAKELPTVKLLIIGEAPKNSLYAKPQTKEDILAEAEKQGLLPNLIFTGNITNLTILQTAYAASDVHVFPVREIPGDPEGFGMVAIEAAAQGLPTVAFATGGITDAVSDRLSGYLVEKNNYSKLTQKILDTLRDRIDVNASVNFSRKFTWHRFNQNILASISIQPKRQPHAVKNLNSRRLKAKKIELLLELEKIKNQQPLRILEIGCGSGGITNYFGSHPRLQCEVTGVDIHDNRQTQEGYKFYKISGVDLPFPNSSFDIVITNHVIEHVGETEEQLKHLSEINRVLAPTGLCYLAVPNRWMLTEPHYNLKFLSWLPHGMRSRYLALAGKGNFYDCEPLELAKLESMLEQIGFQFENLSVRATRITLEQEKPTSISTKIIRRLPNAFLSPLKPIIPTLIYRLKSKN